MAAFALDGQREGFGRLWELDPVVQAAGAASFNDLLARFGHEHSALAAGVRRQRYRNLRELARLGYGDLSLGLVHGDFQRENLLFSRGEFSGLLDFDSIRLDAPVADLAASAWLDCLDPSGDRIDPAAAGAFVEGYAAARPLPDYERRMLPALVRAQMLWFVAFRLMQWSVDRSPAPVQSIARTVNRRLPALDGVTPALERALVPTPAP
jgi:Ser/Thr protein kinase RdoA (MazF antagonist)